MDFSECMKSCFFRDKGGWLVINSKSMFLFAQWQYIYITHFYKNERLTCFPCEWIFNMPHCTYMITILWNAFSHTKTNNENFRKHIWDIQYTLHKTLFTILSLVCIYGWMKQDEEVTYHLSFCSNPECCCIHIHHHIMIIYDFTACFSLVLFFTLSCVVLFYHLCTVCVIWKHWLWALIKLFWFLVLSRVWDFVNVFLTTGFCTFEIKRWKVSKNVASQMWKIITRNSLSENTKSISSCFFLFVCFSWKPFIASG